MVIPPFRKSILQKRSPFHVSIMMQIYEITPAWLFQWFIAIVYLCTHYGKEEI